MVTPGPFETKPPIESPLERLPMARLHIWQIQAVRDLLFGLVLFGVVWVGYAVRSVTVPLLVALLLAYLFEPLVSSLTVRLKTSRPMVVSGLILTIGASMLVLLVILVPLVIGQTVRFVQDLRAGRFQNTVLRLRDSIPPTYQADFERAVQWMMPDGDWGIEHAGENIGEQSSAVREVVPDQAAAISPAMMPIFSNPEDEMRLRGVIRQEIAAHSTSDATSQTLAPASIWDMIRASGRRIFGLIGAVVELGLLAFLIPFYFFFFSVSFPSVIAFGREMIPVKNRPRAIELIRKMDRAVAGFVRGRIVICIIMGIMLAIGWLIAGVPYSIVLGMVVGGFCLVPYLGGIGVPLAIALLAVHQMQLPEAERMSWWAILIWPSAVFAVVQLIENYVLTPMIAGKATNLDPVTILVAVLAGGSIGGMYGMILAIPVAACLKILFTDVLLPKVRAWTRGEAADPLPIAPS